MDARNTALQGAVEPRGQEAVTPCGGRGTVVQKITSEQRREGDEATLKVGDWVPDKEAASARAPS